MRDQLEAKLSRFEELERALVDPAVLTDQQRLSATAREHGTLARLALKYRGFVALERQIAELHEIARGDDAEMKELASAELPPLEQRREQEWEELMDACSGDEDADRARCIAASAPSRAGTWK
jgi:peptide chain release factor 1